MKKWFFKGSLLILVSLMFASCAGGGVKVDPNLPENEKEAVILTQKAVRSNGTIENYSVVTSNLPLALLDNEYKNVRDEVNKARLDYRACITRGLAQHAEKNLETLQNIQQMIIQRDSAINASSQEFIFVLADVKEKTRRDGKLSGYIAIFSPDKVELVDLIQVTTPLYNNAVMVTEALNHQLDVVNNTEPTDLKSTNPVVNFILNSNPK